MSDNRLANSTHIGPVMSKNTKTFRCGGQWPHSRQCPALDQICRRCNKKGHYAKACKTTRTGDSVAVSANAIDPVTDSEYDVGLYKTTSSQSRIEPYSYCLKLNNVTTTMEIDTGAGVSLITKNQFDILRSRDNTLMLSQEGVLPLRTYTGEVIKPLGIVQVDVTQEDSEILHLNVLVVPGTGPNLIGRDWLSKMSLDWTNVFRVSEEDIFEQFPDLFKPGIGTFKKRKIKFHVDPEGTPTFCKPRPVPLALRAKVEEELDRLEKDKIILPVEFRF